MTPSVKWWHMPSGFLHSFSEKSLNSNEKSSRKAFCYRFIPNSEKEPLFSVWDLSRWLLSVQVKHAVSKPKPQYAGQTNLISRDKSKNIPLVTFQIPILLTIWQLDSRPLSNAPLTDKAAAQTTRAQKSNNPNTNDLPQCIWKAYDKTRNEWINTLWQGIWYTQRV